MYFHCYKRCLHDEQLTKNWVQTKMQSWFWHLSWQAIGCSIGQVPISTNHLCQLILADNFSGAFELVLPNGCKLSKNRKNYLLVAHGIRWGDGAGMMTERDTDRSASPPSAMFCLQSLLDKKRIVRWSEINGSSLSAIGNASDRKTLQLHNSNNSCVPIGWWLLYTQFKRYGRHLEKIRFQNLGQLLA